MTETQEPLERAANYRRERASVLLVDDTPATLASK